MKYLFPRIITVFLLLSGCDEQGLNPDTVTDPGFGGTITYVTKVPRDSLKEVRIVAVPYFPVDTSFGQILAKLGDIIKVSEGLNTDVDSGSTVEYEMFTSPRTFFYVAVVQRYGENYFADWRVISVYGYSQANPVPKIVAVTDGKFTYPINFTVDFDNLPPQPF